MFPDLHPTLETRRLQLRPLRAEDATELFVHWSDEEVTRWMTSDPFLELAQAKEMLELLRGLFEARQGIRWAIVERAGGKVIGTCGFHRLSLEHRRAEAGYELGRDWWRKGLATEALSAALDWAFGAAGLNRVEAFVTSGNLASAGLLESLGFAREGTLRDYEFARGRFIDEWCYGLLGRDWKARAS